MSLTVGTCYFESREAAVRYYADQGIDAEGVDRKLAEGEIFLGPPPHAAGDLLHIRDGRYIIEERGDPTQAMPAPELEPEWKWAVVEVFGHRQHVGRICEVEAFGAKMLRIDEPQGEGEWKTTQYAGTAIFSLTFTTEEAVMRRARRPAPTPYLGPTPFSHEGEDDEAEGERHDAAV